MQRYVYVNGAFVNGDAASVPVSDRGLLHGYGLFETLPVHNAVPFRLGDHVDRLLRSAGVLGIGKTVDRAAIEAGARELIAKNGSEQATLRIVLTKGAGEAPTLILETAEPKPYPAEQYENGVTLAISSIQRNPTSPLAGMKTLNYLENVLARQEAIDAGCDEALLMSTEQFVAEGSSANVFFVVGSDLLTPSLDVGILPGITRALAIDLGERQGMRVREEVFTLVDILEATEVMLTSSLMGIMPVYTIDGKSFGPACPGPVTRRLSRAYRDLIRTECGSAWRA